MTGETENVHECIERGVLARMVESWCAAQLTEKGIRMTFIEALKDKMLSKAKASKRELGRSEQSIWFRTQDLAGYYPTEIEELKRAQNVQFLPRIYQEFLESMGHSQGEILFGSADSSIGLLRIAKNMISTRMRLDQNTLIDLGSVCKL